MTMINRIIATTPKNKEAFNRLQIAAAHNGPLWSFSKKEINQLHKELIDCGSVSYNRSDDVLLIGTRRHNRCAGETTDKVVFDSDYESDHNDVTWYFYQEYIMVKADHNHHK